MKLDLTGKFTIHGDPVIFTEDIVPNTSSAVNEPADLAAIIARQTVKTGTCTVVGKTYRYKSDGSFLTISDDGKVNSMWVPYQGKLVYFDPSAIAIMRG